MAHKDKGIGTLVLDRRTPVGRIRVASGTTEVPRFRRLNVMLTDLADAGRLDYLRALRDHRMKPLAAYELYRAHGAAKLPALDAIQGLRDALLAWLETADCGTRQRAAHRTAVNHVTAVLTPDAQMGELPAALRAVRERLRAAHHAPQFNRDRASLQAFVRDTLGRTHPLYAAITDVDALVERKQRVNNPQTPAEVAALAARLADPVHRAAVFGMALTGMGPGEFFGRWTVHADRVHVAGTKREGRVRDVPRVRVDLWQAPRPPRSEDAAWSARKFADALKGATSGAVQPYDLRRSYATWLELAGVPRTRRRLYLGHSAGDVTALYEYQDVARYLAEDAARLAGHLGDSLPALVAPQAAPLAPHTATGTTGR